MSGKEINVACDTFIKLNNEKIDSSCSTCLTLAVLDLIELKEVKPWRRLTPGKLESQISHGYLVAIRVNLDGKELLHLIIINLDIIEAKRFEKVIYPYFKADL